MEKMLLGAAVSTHLLAGPSSACKEGQDEAAEAPGAREAKTHTTEHGKHRQPQHQEGASAWQLAL